MYLSTVLGDDYKYPASHDPATSDATELHEEYDSSLEQPPDLVASDDEDDDVPTAASSASSTASDAEQPVDQPVRYSEIPATTFTRPGALGPGHPPVMDTVCAPPFFAA